MFALALLGALAVAGPAWADFALTIGGTVNGPTPENFNTTVATTASPGTATLGGATSFVVGIPPGSIVGQGSGMFVDNAGAFSGTFKEAVYREANTGTLDFLYQFTNNASSSIGIAGVTPTNYGTVPTQFVTNIGVSNVVPTSNPLGFVVGSGSGITPGSVNRSSDGSAITFSFSSPLSATPLAPGSVSNILFIRTNALNFDQFGSLLVNGQTPVGVNPGSTSINFVLEPSFSAPGGGGVPEPSSIVMGGTAASILAAIFGWRRRKVTLAA